MIFKYITTSFRRLLRQRNYLLINLAGLAVGIAAFIVILLYVTYERGYDKHFENRDNIFRVVEIQNEPGVGNQHVAITMGPLARELKQTFPQIQKVTRVMPAYNVTSVEYEDKMFSEPDMVYADPEMIEMFSVKLIRGNSNFVLKEPNTLIISEDFAEKYFGTVEKAYNNTLLLDGKSYRIDGIIENQSKQTHLYFDVIISMASIENLPEFEWMKHWGSNSFVTYIQLDDKKNAHIINEAFPEFIKDKIFSQDEGWVFLEMYLQPFNEIYLDSQHIKFQMLKKAGDSKLVLIFDIIAVLILLIACVNYINISLARSVKQAREVGMRKVLGADRMSLVYRFISESFVITLLAVLLSVGLLEFILPELNKILGTEFKLDFRDPIFNIGLLLLVLVISLVSGSYPAFYLSRFQPASVLKGGIRTDGKTGFLSKILVVFQFAISIGLIFAILMINDQIKYVQKKDLGINYNHTMFLFFGAEDYNRIDLLKTELLENPAIKSVSGSSFMNGVSGSQGAIYIDDSLESRLTVRFGFVDEDFFPSMDIKITQGRNFDKSIVSDQQYAVILNQSAMRELGWDNITNKRLVNAISRDSISHANVIGVIEDYHYYNLKSLIEPAAYFYAPENFRGVTIRYAGQEKRERIEEFIEGKWREIFPKTPYQSMTSDKYLYESYSNDLKLRSLFVSFAFISMFLSCLGLYGLTSLLIEQKTKIIGIKKVLGSPVYSIILNLIREYLLMVGISGVIAVPIASIFIQRFLDDYPYRIDISILNIVYAISAAIAIAFITIVFKASKTANSNPLDALKYE